MENDKPEPTAMDNVQNKTINSLSAQVSELSKQVSELTSAVRQANADTGVRLDHVVDRLDTMKPVEDFLGKVRHFTESMTAKKA